MKRAYWIDYTRVIAALCVILCHCTESIYNMNIEILMGYSTLSRLFCLFSFTIGRLGVPLFLMISGYLLLDREYSAEKTKQFYRRNLLKLLCITELWILISYLVWCVRNNIPMKILDLVKQLLFFDSFKMNHLWYMPMILECYMLIPFISNALAKTSDSVLLVVVTLSSFILFGVPTFVSITNVVNISVHSQYNQGLFSIYWLYLVLGYVVKKKELVLSRRFAFVLAVLSLLIIVFIQMWAYNKEIKFSLWYNNFFLLLSSFFLFLSFSKNNIPENNVIVRLSNTSFGVYLIHNYVLNIFRPYIIRMNIMLPAKTSLLCLLVIITSYIIAIFLSFSNVGSALIICKKCDE